jgi:hypothetical protein
VSRIQLSQSHFETFDLKKKISDHIKWQLKCFIFKITQGIFLHNSNRTFLWAMETTFVSEMLRK